MMGVKREDIMMTVYTDAEGISVINSMSFDSFVSEKELKVSTIETTKKRFAIHVPLCAVTLIDSQRKTEAKLNFYQD